MEATPVPWAVSGWWAGLAAGECENGVVSTVVVAGIDPVAGMPL